MKKYIINLLLNQKPLQVIKRENVINQLKEDLIGKDSYRGITLTYAWLANQFGHFSLGFIPAFLLYDNLKMYEEYKNPIYASLIVFNFWLFFELYNFLGPLLLNRISVTKIMYIPRKNKYIFRPRWMNIAYDTFTDICFFGIGAFTFSLYVNGFTDVFSLLVVLLLICYLTVASKYWFLTKMYQHHANYPFQFRLSQWDFTISNLNRKRIIEFIKSKESGNHLLIYGSQYSGKTSLGVGILNELSINHKVCLYTSAAKLYTYFYIEDAKLSEPSKIWSWKDADYMIVDDVNPGSPLKEDFVDANTFLRFLDPTNSGEINEFNSEILSKKNIVWILGNYDDTSSWGTMLEQIGVKGTKIQIVNLS